MRTRNETQRRGENAERRGENLTECCRLARPAQLGIDDLRVCMRTRFRNGSSAPRLKSIDITARAWWSRYMKSRCVTNFIFEDSNSSGKNRSRYFTRESNLGRRFTFI